MASPYERGLAAAGTRKARGAYYTPPDVAARVLDLCLDPLLAARAGDPDALGALRVVDPACGDGAFLVAAARRIADALVAAGTPADDAHRRAVGGCVVGVDVDVEAAARCRAALQALAPGADARVRSFDALVDEPGFGADSFDLVVGNPPFLSQLGRATARTPTEAAALRRRYPGLVGAYTDPAALFLVRSLELARPDGGVVALIEPVSVLSSADARAVRARAAASARLVALWSLEAQVFDAAVEVCVPVLERAQVPGGGGDVALYGGRDRRFRASAPAPAPTAPTWSALLAEVGDVPRRDLATSGTIRDLASATADFRDQFYGLAPHVVERPSAPARRFPKLVTTGLVDPARLRWGETDTRFNKVRYRHPRVDVDGLPPDLAAWADRRLVPKVLVATQTRVIEAVVDDAGDLVPSVPLLTVTAAAARDRWLVAAALTSPALAAEALRRHMGSGRSPDALRLRAADLVELPLPAHREPWERAARELAAAHGAGAAEVRRGHLREVGRLVDLAYGLGDDRDLLGWWLGRLPAPSR